MHCLPALIRPGEKKKLGDHLRHIPGFPADSLHCGSFLFRKISVLQKIIALGQDHCYRRAQFMRSVGGESFFFFKRRLQFVQHHVKGFRHYIYLVFFSGKADPLGKVFLFIDFPRGSRKPRDRPERPAHKQISQNRRQRHHQWKQHQRKTNRDPETALGVCDGCDPAHPYCPVSGNFQGRIPDIPLNIPGRDFAEPLFQGDILCKLIRDPAAQKASALIISGKINPVLHLVKVPVKL